MVFRGFLRADHLASAAAMSAPADGSDSEEQSRARGTGDMSLYVCMYVSMYVCRHIFICKHIIYACICTSLSLSIRYTYGCALACMHVSLHVFLYITSIPTLMQMLCTHTNTFFVNIHTHERTQRHRDVFSCLLPHRRGPLPSLSDTILRSSQTQKMPRSCLGHREDWDWKSCESLRDVSARRASQVGRRLRLKSPGFAQIYVDKVFDWPFIF